MDTIDNTQVEQVRSMTNAEMRVAIAELQRQVAELVASKVASETKVEGKEMTDADAERVTYGDLADKKHKDAAAALGLTYGQIYSARLGFTFKAVHKAAKDANKKNVFIK